MSTTKAYSSLKRRGLEVVVACAASARPDGEEVLRPTERAASARGDLALLKLPFLVAP